VLNQSLQVELVLLRRREATLPDELFNIGSTENEIKKKNYYKKKKKKKKIGFR
jgi:hypothetical protein